MNIFFSAVSKKAGFLGLAWLLVVSCTQALTIAPMSWTAGRSDWINVKTDPSLTIHAAGDGVTDDTVALQQAFNLATVPYSTRRAVYLPAGTYKITDTLYWNSNFSAIQRWPGYYGLWLVGCGSNTTIQWAGAAGKVMFLDLGSSRSHYEGIVWNAGPAASAAGFGIAHVSQAYYQTRMRHENEAFIGFTGVGGQGTISVPYVYTNTQAASTATVAVGATTIPLAGIPTGLAVGAGITGLGIPTGPAPYNLTTTTVTAINTSTNVITISAATNHLSNAGAVFSFTNSVAGVPETLPAAGIVAGVQNESSPMAETMVWNCLFQNDTDGVIVGYDYYNDYMWIFKGCEFEGCGYGLNAPAGKCVVEDTHFSGSTVADIACGLTLRARRCTSSGSALFLENPHSGTASQDVVEDCWIDGWTNVNGAIFLQDRMDMVFDCVFSHPPSGAHGAIYQASSVPLDVIYSNNYCPVPGVPINWGGGGLHAILNIPSGGLPSSLASPNQTFLQSTWPADGPIILDITKPPYNAVAGTDSTAAIQAAITQAKANNNGTIVYIPACNNGYLLTSTLNVSGGNYAIQGSGYGSVVAWSGSATSTTPLFTVTTPQNITIEQFLVNMAVSSGISYQPWVSETSTGASNVTYDEVSSGAYSNSPGIVLNSLPAGSNVYMPECDSALTVNDCGAATIFSDYLCFSGLTIGGATHAKTGFLGALVMEGGQNIPTGWDVIVDDNQDFVGVDYYNEQSYNHLLAENTHGATWAGRITMQGMKEESDAPSTTIGIQNYGGRVFYGSQGFLNNNSTPVFTQTGAAPVDLILLGEAYYSNPSFTLGAACNLIAANSYYGNPAITYLTDTLPTGWGPSAAAGLDHLRQAGIYDLAFNYGLLQNVNNTSFETDAVNPNPTTAIGYNPAKWTVANSLAAGGGARNCTVVAAASPFGPGTQGALWVDTTGTATGSGLTMDQFMSALPAGQPGVWSFDFRLNSSANHDDLWVRMFAGSIVADAVHVSYNGTATYLGADIGGHDSYVATPLVDTWYRVRISCPPASGGASHATLYLTPWTASGPGTTTSYTIDAYTAASTSGLSRFNLYSGSPAGVQQSINLDNFTAMNNTVFALP